MKHFADNLSKQGTINYNACDAQGYERGDMGKNRPKVARIYSVYRIKNGVAFCESRDAWGGIHDECFPVNTLEAYKKEKHQG